MCCLNTFSQKYLLNQAMVKGFQQQESTIYKRCTNATFYETYTISVA